MVIDLSLVCSSTTSFLVMLLITLVIPNMTYTTAIELSDLMKGECPTPSSAKTINIDHNCGRNRGAVECDRPSLNPFYFSQKFFCH